MARLVRSDAINLPENLLLHPSSPPSPRLNYPNAFEYRSTSANSKPPLHFSGYIHREQDKFLVSLGRDDKFLDALAETVKRAAEQHSILVFFSVRSWIFARVFNNIIIVMCPKNVDKSLFQLIIIYRKNSNAIYKV